jgi:hypothetical protein
VIETAVDHLRTDPIQGQALDLGDLVTQVDEHGVEQPGGPDLEFDAIGGTRPEIALDPVAV